MTWASWMNPAGSTTNLVGNKSMNVLNIVYLWETIFKVGIVDRAESKDGAGFTARDALWNNGIYGLNILLLFLYTEGLPQCRLTLLGSEHQQWLGDLGDG